MFLKFKKGEQSKLINQAINLAGSERKLAKETGIPSGSIYHYKYELRNISSGRTIVGDKNN